MSETTDGMGGTGPGAAADNQTTTAQANAAQPFGNGKLQGDRADRDVTSDGNYLKRSTTPPAQPATRWSPPKQPVGNPKGKRL